VRGRWFALRNRGVHAGTCAGLVGGGLLLEALEPTRAGAALGEAAGGGGFALVFALAAAARLASAVLLALSPEPRFTGLPARERMTQAFAGRRGRRVSRQIALVALMQLAVWTSSPYYGPYMLGELAFSYVQYMAAYVVLVLAKVLLLPRWGDLIDRHGARSVLLLAAVGVALIPLPWAFATAPLLAFVGQTLSGAAWAGFEVGQLTLLVETTRRRTRAIAFAAQSAANGLGQLGGTLAGAFLAAQLGGLRGVFAFSLVARLCVAFAFPRGLPRLAGEGSSPRRALALRVLGLRPAGGLAYRVVDEPSEPRPGP
jgi:predicted MFS family arabinose efflux permease